MSLSPSSVFSVYYDKIGIKFASYHLLYVLRCMKFTSAKNNRILPMHLNVTSKKCKWLHFSCVVLLWSCAGSSFEEQIVADVSEQDDKPRSYLCIVCDKRFTTKWYLNARSKLHSGQNLYSCSECEKRFPTLWCLKSHKNGHSSK